MPSAIALDPVAALTALTTIAPTLGPSGSPAGSSDTSDGAPFAPMLATLMAGVAATPAIATAPGQSADIVAKPHADAGKALPPGGKTVPSFGPSSLLDDHPVDAVSSAPASDPAVSGDEPSDAPSNDPALLWLMPPIPVGHAPIQFATRADLNPPDNSADDLCQPPASPELASLRTIAPQSGLTPQTAPTDSVAVAEGALPAPTTSRSDVGILADESQPATAAAALLSDTALRSGTIAAVAAPQSVSEPAPTTTASDAPRAYAALSASPSLPGQRAMTGVPTATQRLPAPLLTAPPAPLPADPASTPVVLPQDANRGPQPAPSTGATVSPAIVATPLISTASTEHTPAQDAVGREARVPPAAPMQTPVQAHTAPTRDATAPVPVPPSAAALVSPPASLREARAATPRYAVDAVAADGPLRALDLALTITPTAIQPMAAAQPGIDLTRDPGLHQVIDRIAALRDAAADDLNARDTRIRLIPDALGPVDIAVRRNGDGVQVRFTAHEAATRQLIADAQPRLAELADARGVRIDRATVETSSQSATGFAGQSHGEQHHPQPGRQPVQTPRRAAPAFLPDPAAADTIGTGATAGHRIA